MNKYRLPLRQHFFYPYAKTNDCFTEWGIVYSIKRMKNHPYLKQCPIIVSRLLLIKYNS